MQWDRQESHMICLGSKEMGHETAMSQALVGYHCYT